jgi:hypothetical protein
MGYGINFLRPQAILGGFGIGPQDYGMGGEDQFMTPQQPMMPPPQLSAPMQQQFNPSDIPFQVGPPQGGPPPPVTPPRVSAYDRVNQVYTPETRAGNRLNALLDAPPQMDMDPSFMRRFSASLAGIGKGGGVPTMDRILQSPYLQDMADWQAKAKPFHDAASLENTGNINERQLAGNVITAEMQAEKLAENARQADQRNEVARTANRIRDAKNNGITVKLDGNKWVGFDLNGKRYELGTSTGMTREDIIDAQGEWNVKAADARAASSLANTQAAGATFVVGSDGKLYPVNPRTTPTGAENLPPGAPTRVGTPSRGTGTGTGSADELSDKLEHIWLSEPDAREYITIGKGNKYGMAPMPEKKWTESTETFNRRLKRYEDIQKRSGAIDRTTENELIRDAAATSSTVRTTPPTGGYKGPPTPPEFRRSSPPPAKDTTGGPMAPTTPPVSLPPRKSGESRIGPAPPLSTGRGTGYDPNHWKIVETYEDRQRAEAARNAAASTPTYKTYTDSNNPMNKRRTSDGRTFEISTDGGKTWKRE